MVASADLGLSSHSPLSPRHPCAPNLIEHGRARLLGPCRECEGQKPGTGRGRGRGRSYYLYDLDACHLGQVHLHWLGGRPNIALGCGPALVERVGFPSREGSHCCVVSGV